MCIKLKDRNEIVIGKLFGHSPTTVIERYGSIDMKMIIRALEQLNKLPPKSPVIGQKMAEGTYQGDT